MKLLFPRPSKVGNLTKVCAICDKRKPTDSYAVTNTESGSRHSYCKPCLKLYNQHRYQSLKSKS